MNKHTVQDVSKLGQTFAMQVGAKAERKGRAESQNVNDVWLGVGMMGLIGWSVTIPTFIGLALGLWLDSHFEGSHSWTLALLAVGLTTGCFNAWHWVEKESEAICDEEKNR